MTGATARQRNTRDRVRRWGFRIVRLIAASVSIIIVLLSAAWLAGRILTDRYAWSQWLFWIPTPAILAAAVLAFALALIPSRSASGRRRRIICWSVWTLALLIYFGAVEHRFLHRAAVVPPDASVMKIVHWNVQPSTNANVPPSVELMKGLDGDITVITNPGGFHMQQVVEEMFGQPMFAATVHPFGLFSRLPIVQIRPLIMVDGMYVVVVELEATERFGGTLTLYMVDLPSSPKLGRMQIARRVRRMLDELSAPVPDIVVGDFNITRDGATLHLLFPNMRHAFDEAGHGYGATFPRTQPLYHIDHVLVGSDFSALRYDIIDPGSSRHRAQVAWLAMRRQP